MNKKKSGDHISDFSVKLYKSRGPVESVMPEKNEAQNFADEFLQILFPHFGKKVFYSPEDIEIELLSLRKKLIHILKPLKRLTKNAPEEIAEIFCATSAALHDSLILDAKAILEGDPAAENIDEVIVAYPGFFAIAVYRIAHEFYKHKVPIFPRILTEYAHQQTGIDIHPGAMIGKSFFIDHGTGVVVGETTIIGENVKIYQGVTLGALSVDKILANTKRHPTIEDNVVIYSGATILGGQTVIGHHSIIGGNVWLTETVQPYSVVYNKSEIKVRNAKDFGNEPINFVI